MKIKKFFSDFATFLKRGNAFDLAVGIVIGGAFQKIVSSLVNDIIMPLISMIGGVNVSDAKWVMKPAVYNGDQLVSDAITLNYGSFIQTVIDFLIIAFAIFIAIKVAAKLSEGFKKAQKDVTSFVDKKVTDVTAKVTKKAKPVKKSEVLEKQEETQKPQNESDK